MDDIATDVSGQGSETQPENNAAAAPGSEGGFSVPEAYKEAGWSKNIKSYDDLWKMNANAQTLIGKKTIGFPTRSPVMRNGASFTARHVRPRLRIMPLIWKAKTNLCLRICSLKTGLVPDKPRHW